MEPLPTHRRHSRAPSANPNPNPNPSPNPNQETLAGCRRAALAVQKEVLRTPLTLALALTLTLALALTSTLH